MTLIGGVLALVIWILFGFVVPVGTGWIHLFLGLGMVLLVRRVVLGTAAR